MAAFREHLTFSCALGAGYTATLVYGLGQEWSHSLVAGLLCGFAGMLPDLDSDSGKPAREIFGLVGTVIPLILLRRLYRAGFDPETTLLLAATAYLIIRFAVSRLFFRITVHRGMFHSLPAALIAAQIVFLAHDRPELLDRIVLAVGVFLGFLSHLILDEIYSVDIGGVVPKLKSSAGSALKLASQSMPATFATWTLLCLLTYAIGVQQGYVQPIHLEVPAVLRKVQR
jgi:membrane-bound metal-dependent hydrolase YbcI (DUF457 family)